MAFPILGVLGVIIKPALEIAKDWMAKRRARVDGEIAITQARTEARIKRLQTAQEGDIAWENTAIVNAGIKDEVMMFVILAPMVLCFIPGGAEYVQRGFTAMNASLPSYWEYAFYATIGVSYGIRKFTDFMSIKKGA